MVVLGLYGFLYIYIFLPVYGVESSSLSKFVIKEVAKQEGTLLKKLVKKQMCYWGWIFHNLAICKSVSSKLKMSLYSSNLQK